MKLVEPITYEPIGIVRSPFKEPRGTPIQPPAAAGVEAVIELDAAYADGLKDLDGFSHIVVIYHFHLSKPLASLRATPYLDDEAHGVFAMRGPSRPNSVGLSIVRLLKIERSLLRIADVDIVDGTPVLDLKPYVPQFDVPRAVSAGRGVRVGWLAENVHKLSGSRDDGRFAG